MIIVWREAELDPAEPMLDVPCGANRTSRTPSSVRTICVSTASRPCPTSTAAVSTSATGPAESVTRASDESSKPSL